MLQVELPPRLGDIARAKRPERLPVVLTRTEVQAVLAHLEGTPRLASSLLYGSGLRLMECLRLRIKDVDFEQAQLVVREGKGDKDRVTMLPDTLRPSLQEHLERVRRVFEQDRANGVRPVYLPAALERKYPGAGTEWGW